MASGSEKAGAGKEAQGLSGKEEEEEARDQDRRVGEAEEQATLSLEEEEAERPMGSKREEMGGARERGLRRGREGERAKAELFIVEDLNEKEEGGRMGRVKLFPLQIRERVALEVSVHHQGLVSQ